MNRLTNKVAVITGAANGIGKATALRFAEEGASVVIWDVQKEKGLELLSILQKMNCPSAFFEVDISNAEMVKKTAAEAKNEFGKIDILINNAGILRDATLLKMTERQFDQVIDINLKGVFNCTQAIAPYMIENRYGRIVQASSIVGLYGNFGQTNYVASKAGVIGMTKVWARELGPKGITVNAIAPGFIATDMVESIPEELIKMMKEKIPLKRMGTPEDVANLNLFLASDEASYLNGTVISIDGGATI